MRKTRKNRQMMGCIICNSYLVLKVSHDDLHRDTFINLAGDNDGEGPPVPIPNTAVKLIGAEDTWMVTSRENRASPALKERTGKENLILCCSFHIPQ